MKKSVAYENNNSYKQSLVTELRLSAGYNCRLIHFSFSLLPSPPFIINRAVIFSVFTFVGNFAREYNNNVHFEGGRLICSPYLVIIGPSEARDDNNKGCK